jgi:hypothetical protein
MEALGYNVTMVVKEELGTAELNEEMWKGSVYLDKEKAFFKYVGGGDLHTCDLERRNDPDVNEHREAAKAKYGGNLIGEGLQMGGTIIVSKGGIVQYSFL